MLIQCRVVITFWYVTLTKDDLKLKGKRNVEII